MKVLATLIAIIIINQNKEEGHAVGNMICTQ